MSDSSQSSSFAARGVTARGVVTQQLPVIRPLCIESVCRADESVILRFATQEGILPVHLSLREFNRKCRGPLDTNGADFNPHRCDIDQLEIDAQQVPITKGGPDRFKNRFGPHRYGNGGLPPEKLAALRQAWAEVRINGATLNLSEIAAKVGCAFKTVKDHFVRFDAQAANQPDAPEDRGQMPEVKSPP